MNTFLNRNVGPSKLDHTANCTNMQSPIITCLILACLCTSGCETGDGLAYVEGEVTLNGQPLENATVEFQPATQETAPSSGRTDSDGRYELQYTFDTSGAMPGEYVVSIHTAETFFDAQGLEREHRELVPTQYNARTTLKRTIELGNNRIDFDL